MKKHWFAVLALAMGAVFAAPAAAQTEAERLQREITELRGELDALKTVKREGQGSDEPIKTQLKKSVFSWATEDGKYSFEMNFRVQFRVT